MGSTNYNEKNKIKKKCSCSRLWRGRGGTHQQIAALSVHMLHFLFRDTTHIYSSFQYYNVRVWNTLTKSKGLQHSKCLAPQGIKGAMSHSKCNVSAQELQELDWSPSCSSLQWNWFLQLIQCDLFSFILSTVLPLQQQSLNILHNWSRSHKVIFSKRTENKSCLKRQRKKCVGFQSVC